MKVEKAFTIDGKVVSECFQKGNITVYINDKDITEVICYYVDNKSSEVLFKQRVSADMGQGTGYISDVTFVGVH